MPAKKTTATRKTQGSAKQSAKKSATGSTRASAKAPAKKAAAKKTGQAKRAATPRSGNPLIDHEEIRQWAEERGAQPSCVRNTGGGGDVGMIRLDFPGYSGADSLEPIEWDEWFQKFDENGLALIVQNTTARGQKSNFNKLVKRTTAAQRPRTRAAG